MGHDRLPIPPMASLLTIPEIAAWQLDLGPMVVPPVRALLPALQRSAVWAPGQIEALWDSVVRGFPIGALLATPWQPGRGGRPLAYGQGRAGTPVHLVDGQQRANALALGFLDPWHDKALPQPSRATLWVDLDAHAAGDREFVFRVCTAWHPWGYRRNDPTRRLASAHRRAALDAYRQAADDDAATAAFTPGGTDLTRVWPWEAAAPIPLAFLARALLSAPEEPWPQVATRMAELPFWKPELVPAMGRVRSTLALPTPHMRRLAEGLAAAIRPPPHGRYYLPLLVLPEVAPVPADRDLAAPDPIETLFLRVNTGGTPLSQEELNYALVKSVFPEAEHLVAAIGMRLTAPARTVVLLSRLVLSRGSEVPPPAPDVARFRRLIHGGAEGNTFRAALIDELQGNARQLFADARAILGGTGGAEDHRLVAALAADLGETAPDALFLLLVWLERFRDRGGQLTELDITLRRRLLGLVTAIAWFAADAGQCVRALWPLLSADPVALLQDKPLARCFRRQRPTGAPAPMPPLFPPDMVEAAVDATLTGRGTKSNPNNEFYTPSSGAWWYERMERIADKPKLVAWARSRVKWRTEDEDGTDPAQAAWSDFISRLWNLRPLVLYAQRHWLQRWFPDFDPMAVHQAEDTDRPWDIDHIHPQKYVAKLKNIPWVVRDMQQCIGNLRAWPMELNRGDGDDHPQRKLNPDFAVHRESWERFGIGGRADLCTASFIAEPEDWDADLPPGAPTNYLARPAFFPQRKKLLMTIAKRWVALYQEWYVSLEIGKLV